MILKSDAKSEEKPICCFRNDKNLVNFDPSTQVSKICAVICPFCAKHITFDQKKYRVVIFNDIEEWCKIWRKIGLWFGKWHEEFDKFSSEHLKVSKLVLSWNHFVQSRKCMSSDVSRRIFIPVYPHGRPNSGAQKMKYTFIYTIILHRRLFLPFRSK